MIKELANELGFRECYVLPNEKYDDWERRRESGAFHKGTEYIKADPTEAYKGKNVLLILLWPYSPYEEQLYSAYYTASNASYHAMTSFVWQLRAKGLEAEKADVPMRHILASHGIGRTLKSALLYIPPYGTRFCLQAVAIRLEEFELSKPMEVSGCLDCGLCSKACPNAAIGEDGFDFHRCIRAGISCTPIPEWTMERMSSYLGCEVCQGVCPLNADIKPIPAPDELKEAFRIERLLSGDVQDAERLCGKNMSKKQRFVTHAAVLAGNYERVDCLPRLKELAEDESTNESCKAACGFAIGKLT